MNNSKLAVSTALRSDRPIPREAVREWVAQTQDLETLALLYRLTDEGWHRIEPRLEPAETCEIIRTYLRPLFEHWGSDEQLRDAWNAAIEWADAHPNFMKNLRAGVK